MLADDRGMSERVCRSDQKRRDKSPESINDAVALSCVSVMKQRQPRLIPDRSPGFYSTGRVGGGGGGGRGCGSLTSARCYPRWVRQWPSFSYKLTLTRTVQGPLETHQRRISAAGPSRRSPRCPSSESRLSTINTSIVAEEAGRPRPVFSSAAAATFTGGLRPCLRCG